MILFPCLSAILALLGIVLSGLPMMGGVSGWAYWVTNRMVDGHRIYSAQAWRDEEEGGPLPVYRDLFSKVALAGAWVAAERWYWRRPRQQAKQANEAAD